jgi:bacterioferritin-associated ferredoxin
MYMCLCKGLTEQDVVEVAGGKSMPPCTLIQVLGLDDDVCCGRCAEEIDDFVVLLSRHTATRAPALAT